MLRRVKYILLAVAILSLTVIFAESDLIVKKSSRTYSTTSAITNPSEKQLIYENDVFKFYFRDSRDVLFVEDKRNGYTWQSGLDIASSKAVKRALRDEEPLGFEPLEQRMNETFTDLANSFIVVEYYDDSLGIKRLSSASEDATSNLLVVEDEDNHFILDIAYEAMDIQLKAHIYLTSSGYETKILEEEITGADKAFIAAVVLNPFLGASGGEYALYDPETGKHGDPVKKPEIPGYVLVPDGPGALIEFNDYGVSMKAYQSKVYGENLSKGTYNYNLGEIYYVPFKNPSMPLYGIAHTAAEAAFIGYATSGDTNMEIVVMPEENTTLYTWAYPRFVKNKSYYQVFNKRGEGYFTLFDEPNAYDIEFKYDFIAETDHVKADYTGMALRYRQVLEERNILGDYQPDTVVPTRIDFIMSDPKKSVLGFENVVVTTAEDTSEILTLLTSDGVENINTGLYGWQEGGVTTGEPWQSNWSRRIGTKGDFKTLLESPWDISFAQDYLKFSPEVVSETGKAIKHINNWYLVLTEVDDQPFTEFYYAKPAKSVEWLTEQFSDLRKLNPSSHTIEGISSYLFTEHGKEVMQEEDVVQLYQEALANLDIKLNLKTPNQYLWQFTDRFLQAPVYPTQYLIETQTVPFLSMVLNGAMEVYAPYSNFSFSGQKDVLKMIDYNMYPSFMLTMEPSYLLSSTNSLDFYSTEYEQYKTLIPEIYTQVAGALNPVMDAKWISRESKDGVTINTYDNGITIVINYNTGQVQYNDFEIEGLSYKVIQ